MKRMWKRIVSLLLVFNMVFSMAIPSYAVSAVNENEEAEITAVEQEPEPDSEVLDAAIQDTTVVNFTTEERAETVVSDTGKETGILVAEPKIGASEQQPDADSNDEDYESQKLAEAKVEAEKNPLIMASNFSRLRSIAALSSSDVTYSNNYMFNDYLSIYFSSSTNFSIGTKEGNPNSSTDNEQMLLFCWPYSGTSRWMLSVDNSITQPDGISLFSNGVMTFEGEYNGISYTKTFRLVKSKTSGNEDVAEISMTVTNNGSDSKKVGARIAFDTDVAGNDSAPFYIASKGKFDTGLVLSGDDIPQYWQAMDNLPSPTVLAQGTFYQQATDRPDRVYFGSYGSLCGSYTLTPPVAVDSCNYDSAVSAAWFEKELAPGESRTYTTWLGVGEMSQEVNKDVTLSVNAALEGTISNNHQGYESVEVVSYVQNNGTTSLTGLKAEVILPEGLALQEGEQSVQTLDSLDNNGTTTATWHLISQPAETGASYNYTINILDSDGNIIASVSKDLEMPVLDLVAPVLSGTAQVQNRASASAEIILPTATDSNGIKLYHLVCEELNLDQTISTANENTVSGKVSERITGLSEGKTYEVQITAEDVYGNISEVQTVDVSALKPTINSQKNAVLGGRKTDAELKATAQCEDSQAVYSVTWKPVGDGEEQLLHVVTSGDNNEKTLTAQWDISTLESGDYEVVFSVTDRDGMVVSNTTTCAIDNTPPGVVTSILAQGDYTSIRLSWNIASEYKVNGYRIYRGQAADNLELFATISNRNTVNYEDSDVAADTAYWYYVTAVDKYDMESAPSEIVQGALKKDEEVPQVTSLTPASGKTFAGVASFTAKAQDNLGVASVELQYRQGSSGEWTSLKTATADTCTATLDTTTISDGKIQVRAIAVDTSGNASVGTPVYTYTVDNTGPSKVTDISYTSTSTTITLAWKYVQENDFDHFVVEEKINGVFETLTVVRNTLGVNLNVKPGSDHIYRVYTVDRVGNKGEVSEEIQASSQRDTTAPIVSAISPNAGYHNSDFTVSITMKDNDAVESAKIQISTDKTNWITVEEQKLATPASEATITYRVQVKNYEDGSIYVRAIPTDVSGNEGNSNNASAPFVQYIIDRIPPAVPSGLKVSPVGKSLYIQWDNDANGETESYRLLRADSMDGVYGEVVSNMKSISYYDRAAKADTTYWYKIQGRDTAGNWSDESAAVSGSWLSADDNEKPVILSISPEDKSLLGGTAKVISVLAQDNQTVSRIEVTYQKDGILFFDGEKHTLTIDGNDSYYLRGSVNPDLSLYKSGDKLKVFVVAYDANNNQSEKVEVTYTIDLTAPSISDLRVDNSLNSEAPIITWTAGENSNDLNGYYIYRSSDNGSSWTKIGTRGRREDHQYSFEDVLTNSGTYIYKVTALDLLGNQTDAISDSVTYKKPKRVVADFITDNQQQQGVEYLFDARASYSDDGIESYLFDFGDGKTSEQMQAVHKYEELGNYTVTLTVTDTSGKTSVASQMIEVKERASLGKLTVTVVDDSGVPVSNAPVYFNMGEEDQTIRYTDGSGVVTFTNTAGSYKVGTYLDQYLPVAKQIIVAGGSERQVELIMVKQPIVTGSFEVNRMTLDEIKAADIDINDPANQNCIQMTVHLVYGEYSKDIDCTYNGNGQIINGSNSVVINDKRFEIIPFPDTSILYGDGGGNGSGGGSGSGSGGSGGGSVSEVSKVVAIMELPVNASGLKEFFDVKLHIINNASEEFSLKDNSISLNVPDGLYLMPQSQNTVLDVKENLPGQSEWALSWILRGDVKGDYDLSADYNGTLAEFNAPVAATFRTKDPIHVYGMDAYKIILDINSSILYGGLYFNLGLQNVSDVDMYMPKIDIGENIIKVFELSKGEEEKPEVTVRNVSVTNSSGYVQYLGSKGSVDTLAAGETLTKQYLLYNSVTSTDITYLREVAVDIAEDLGIQIEINYVNMDLFSSVNADEKFESIMTDSVKKSAYDYMMDNGEFYYFQQALSDDNFATNLGQEIYRWSNAVINLDWGSVTEENERDIARQFIYELLQDESFQQAVEAKIDNTYLTTTQKVIGNIKGMLASDMSDYVCDGWDLDDVNNVLNQTNNIRTLSKALQNGGTEGFKDRLRIMLGSAIGAGGAKVVQELLEQDGFLINSYNEGMLGVVNCFSAETKKILGEVGDALGTVNQVVTAWNDSVELTNQLVAINAAQDQALLLTELILQNDNIKGTATYEEVQDIHDQLINGFKKQQTLFIEEIQKSLLQDNLTGMVVDDLLIGSVDKIFFANAAYGVGTVLTTIRAVYNMADYIFKWDETANVYKTLRVSAYLTIAIQDSTQKAQAKAASEDGTILDKQNFMNALKYLVKVRLVGERSFIRIISDYAGMNNDYTADHALECINKEMGHNFTTLDEYYLWFKAKMLGYRDSLYDEVTDDQEQPKAPEVSIDYIGCKTLEKFGDNYEYSFDNATWKTCGTELGEESSITLSPKAVGQILYVRHKETEGCRVGKTTAVRILAQRSLRYATFAGTVDNYSVIRGLEKNRNYQVVRAESNDAASADWTKAVIATSDQNGQLVADTGTVGNYVFYRLPADVSQFASVAHSIDASRNVMVKITATAQGDGQVQCEDSEFVSRILAHDETLTLKAVYDKATVEFLGWYQDGILYSTKEVLELDATRSLDLTAKFESLPQYTLTVSAGEGGKVIGGGTAYKGTKLTAKAIADTGYTFQGWKNESGLFVGVNSTRTVTMMEDVSLTAVFEKLPTARVQISMDVQNVPDMEKPTATVTISGQDSVEVTPDRPFDKNELIQNIKVTVTANDSKDATFVNWQTENGMIVSTDRTFTFNAEEYTHYIATYKVSGQSVIFVSSFGYIQSNKQYPASVSADSITLENGVTRISYDFIGWRIGTTTYPVASETEQAALKNAILSEIQAGRDVILNAVYEQQPVRYTVTVINGTGGGTYDANAVVTVTSNKPEEGMNFAGWYEGDTLLTTNRSYSFYVLADRTLTAKYTENEVEEVGTTRIETVSANKATKKISFVSMSSVPNSCKIQKAGVIATSNGTIGNDVNKFTAATATYVRYGTTSAKNYRYTWTKGNVTAGQTWYVRAYLVYTDANGNSHTIYGNIVAANLNGVIE